jgi:hypothetical protein
VGWKRRVFPGAQSGFDGAIDVPELRIAIGMIFPPSVLRLPCRL